MFKVNLFLLLFFEFTRKF